jgi:hypothetical protein
MKSLRQRWIFRAIYVMNLASMQGRVPRYLALRCLAKFVMTHDRVVVITGSDDRRRRFPPDRFEGSGSQR